MRVLPLPTTGILLPLLPLERKPGCRARLGVQQTGLSEHQSLAHYARVTMHDLAPPKHRIQYTMTSQITLARLPTMGRGGPLLWPTPHPRLLPSERTKSITAASVLGK